VPIVVSAVNEGAFSPINGMRPVSLLISHPPLAKQPLRPSMPLSTIRIVPIILQVMC